MLYILLTSIIVIIFFCLCCSVKQFYHIPRVLPFPSDSLPHPNGEREGVRERLRGSLLPTEAKP